MHAPDTASSLPCWDPWILKVNGRYQLFYLTGSIDQDPWWKTSWICGGYSEDMRHWQHTGAVLEPLPNKGWESGRLFAGSAHHQQGTSYLFYSAASEADITHETIGVATAGENGLWQRSSQPLLSFEEATAVRTASGIGYAGRCRWSNHLHWRDPYFFKAEKSYLFFCASLTTPGQPAGSDSARFQGGLGVAVADSPAGPYTVLPPAAGPGIVEASLWPFYHLERPQVIYFNHKYHLFFSCFKAFINPLWLEQIGEHTVTDSTLYWYVSDHLTGPFYPSSDRPVVPGSDATELYGTTFFPLGTQPCDSTANKLELAVLGWYTKTYRLAIAQEFKAFWHANDLKIVPNS